MAGCYLRRYARALRVTLNTLLVRFCRKAAIRYNFNYAAALKDIKTYKTKFDALQNLSPAAFTVLNCFKSQPELRLANKAICEITNLPRRAVTHALNIFLNISLFNAMAKEERGTLPVGILAFFVHIPLQEWYDPSLAFYLADDDV